jgi:glutaredoxin 3
LILELYFYEQCPFCVRVLRKIDDLDLKDHIQFKNTLEDPNHASSHQERTGRSTVPCLYIDNQAMFESLDIIEWLERNQEKIKAK